jgi:membrane protease subunit (stomatin/prohibitin family)
MAHVEFTDNYQDLSTDQGFQFKFMCESCGNGYMSSWQANQLGMAGDALRAAGSIFGGVFGRAASGSYEIQRAVGGPQHDRALSAAVAEIKPLFIQCKRCGKWVCKEICWNAERALCKNCAPILQRELAAKQAEITVEQAEQKLREQDLTAGINVTAEATVACPACGKETKPGKFCSECGAALRPKGECPKCGAKVDAKDKFCPECGQKLT